MKKSLIALAVLAASGAAMAQSSVTIYGVADIWVGSAKTEINTGDGWVGERNSLLADGGVSNSRLGFKGVEDLGGGLKALFTLEQGVNLTNGDGGAFSREASIGLAGAFGEVKAGKVWNAFDDVSGGAASTFDSDLAPINNVFVSTLLATNPNSGIRYSTPNFGGFSGAVSFALPGDKGGDYDSASKFTAVSAKYEGGPIYVGFGYAVADQAYTEEASLWNEDFDTGLEGAEVKATRLNGSYDFGVAKLLASYGQLKISDFDAKTSEYEIGVNVPLAANLALSGGYAQSKLKVGGATQVKASSVGLAVAYSLSKRTTAYAGLNNTDFKDGAGEKFAKSSIYAVGLKHTF